MDNDKFRYLRIAALAIIAIFLTWEIITRSFGAYLADAAPQAAINIRSANAPALLNLVEKELEQVQVDKEKGGVFIGLSPGDNARLRDMTQTALLHDPLNARALRILGRLAEARNDPSHAEKLMQAAVLRSLQDTLALGWMVQRSYQRQDYQAASRYTDIILRTRPQVIAALMPTLAAMAEKPDAAVFLRQVLAENPPWRPQFFASLPQNVTNARTPLELFLSIKDTPSPPMAKDLQNYLNFLVGRNFYDLAYYTWLQFLTKEELSNVGHLFNGSFESAPSGLPFDWVISAGSGVTVEFINREDKPQDRALLVEFGHGRVEFQGITQLVVLSPGTYKFRGNYIGSLVGRRGLVWSVSCAGTSATPIGSTPMFIGMTPAWKAFEFSFTVPPTDCRAQTVKLTLDARSESEQFVSGAMTYDELGIVRAESAASSKP